MLKTRNCDVSGYEAQTKDELNIIYQQHGSKGNSAIDTLDILVTRNKPKGEVTSTNDEETEPEETKPEETKPEETKPEETGLDDVETKEYKILVKYLTNNKVRNQNIINTIDDIYEQEVIGKEDVLIIVTKDKVTYQGMLEEYINRIFYKDGIFVQIMWLSTLLFNISKHELVPKYSIMTEKDKNNLVEKLYIESIKKLPYVLVTDPVARFYGVRIGQVCEIEYNNETNGKNKFYRLCVAN